MLDGFMLDTSFLIRFLDKDSGLHQTAHDYFRYLMENRIPMFVSSIAIAEYCVKGDFSDLPLRNIMPIGFNIDHAIKAGEMMSVVYQERRKRGAKIQPRMIIPNDTKMFAQADADERISYFLSSDSEAEKVYNLMKGSITPHFQFIDISKTNYHQVFSTFL